MKAIRLFVLAIVLAVPSIASAQMVSFNLINQYGLRVGNSFWANAQLCKFDPFGACQEVGYANWIDEGGYGSIYTDWYGKPLSPGRYRVEFSGRYHKPKPVEFQLGYESIDLGEVLVELVPFNYWWKEQNESEMKRSVPKDGGEVSLTLSVSSAPAWFGFSNQVVILTSLYMKGVNKPWVLFEDKKKTVNISQFRTDHTLTAYIPATVLNGTRFCLYARLYEFGMQRNEELEDVGICGWKGLNAPPLPQVPQVK
jgi:hypothetical protein